MYNSRILADSYSGGVRLTTFEITLPRFILAEFNTHRALSRNSASSRAIPTEKLMEQARTDPFVPIFNRRVKGMGVGEPFSAAEQATRRRDWLSARDNSLRAAERFLDTDKSRCNRLLEPFLWQTIIVTATDWGNFFALRTAPDAQPEFRTIALMMRETMRVNVPWSCEPRCWHLPLCQLEEMGDPIDYPFWKMVSVGRCARVSYLTHDGKRDPTQDVGRHNHLLTDYHLSPFEHVARPFLAEEHEAIKEQQIELRVLCGKRFPQLVDVMCRQLEYCGNFKGWWQYRADIPNQHDFSLAGAAKCVATS